MTTKIKGYSNHRRLYTNKKREKKKKVFLHLSILATASVGTRVTASVIKWVTDSVRKLFTAKVRALVTASVRKLFTAAVRKLFTT